MKHITKRIPLICGILFLLTTVISVAAAWTSGVHLYDLSITFSAYVGLQHSTSILYFCTTVIIVALMILYMIKEKLPLAKKIIYSLTLFCIFGTAFFPFNTFSRNPTPLTINLHNYFAIALMLFTTTAFIISALTSKQNKLLRGFSLFSIGYATAFIVCFFMAVRAMFQTIFIWENLFIVLLLLELHAEQYRTKNTIAN